MSDAIACLFIRGNFLVGFNIHLVINGYYIRGMKMNYIVILLYLNNVDVKINTFPISMHMETPEYGS
jgi:hypothetical protein